MFPMNHQKTIKIRRDATGCMFPELSRLRWWIVYTHTHCITMWTMIVNTFFMLVIRFACTAYTNSSNASSTFPTAEVSTTRI